MDRNERQDMCHGVVVLQNTSKHRGFRYRGITEEILSDKRNDRKTGLILQEKISEQIGIFS
jgi:hypothetical protein